MLSKDAAMSAGKALIMGAVAYDPKVVTIWDGFQKYFRARDLDFDYVLFSNYEKQVEAHFQGLIDVAWNSPLAWLQSERVAKACGRHAEAMATGSRQFRKHLLDGYLIAVCTARWAARSSKYDLMRGPDHRAGRGIPGVPIPPGRRRYPARWFGRSARRAVAGPQRQA